MCAIQILPPVPAKRNRIGQIFSAINTITGNIEKTKIKRENEQLMAQLSGIERTKQVTDPNFIQTPFNRESIVPTITVDKTPQEIQAEGRAIIAQFRQNQTANAGGFFAPFNPRSSSRGITPIEQSIGASSVREIFDPEFAAKAQERKQLSTARQLAIEKSQRAAQAEDAPGVIKSQRAADRIAQIRARQQLAIGRDLDIAKAQKSAVSAPSVEEIKEDRKLDRKEKADVRSFNAKQRKLGLQEVDLKLLGEEELQNLKDLNKASRELQTEKVRVAKKQLPTDEEIKSIKALEIAEKQARVDYLIAQTSEKGRLKLSSLTQTSFATVAQNIATELKSKRTMWKHKSFEAKNLQKMIEGKDNPTVVRIKKVLMEFRKNNDNSKWQSLRQSLTTPGGSDAAGKSLNMKKTETAVITAIIEKIEAEAATTSIGAGVVTQSVQPTVGAAIAPASPSLNAAGNVDVIINGSPKQVKPDQLQEALNKGATLK